MAGIYQQIPSFGFVAADDGVAAEKIQVNCFSMIDLERDRAGMDCLRQ